MIKSTARLEAEQGYKEYFGHITTAKPEIKEQIIEQGKTMIQSGVPADVAFKHLAKEYIVETPGDDHGA